MLTLRIFNVNITVISLVYYCTECNEYHTANYDLATIHTIHGIEILFICLVV